MKKSKTIKLDDREITVTELTPTQVDDLVRGFNAERSANMVELLMDSPISTEAVTLSTGMSLEEMMAMTPTELHAVWGAVAEVNDFLSRMLDRMLAIAEKGTTATSAGPSAD